jgi:hypothetical protein
MERLLTFVAVALASIDEIIKAGGNVAALIAQVESTIHTLLDDHRDPSQDEWDAMNAQIIAAIDALD